MGFPVYPSLVNKDSALGKRGMILSIHMIDDFRGLAINCLKDLKGFSVVDCVYHKSKMFKEFQRYVAHK